MENFSYWNFNSKLQLKKILRNMKNFPHKGNTGSCATACCTIVAEAINSSICCSFSLHNKIYTCSRLGVYTLNLNKTTLYF